MKWERVQAFHCGECGEFVLSEAEAGQHDTREHPQVSFVNEGYGACKAQYCGCLKYIDGELSLCGHTEGDWKVSDDNLKGCGHGRGAHLQPGEKVFAACDSWCDPNFPDGVPRQYNQWRGQMSLASEYLCWTCTRQYSMHLKATV